MGSIFPELATSGELRCPEFAPGRCEDDPAAGASGLERTTRVLYLCSQGGVQRTGVADQDSFDVVLRRERPERFDGEPDAR